MPLLKPEIFLRDSPFQIQTIAFATETNRVRRVKLDQNQDSVESVLNLPSALHESLWPILLCYLGKGETRKGCAEEKADREWREVHSAAVSITGRWRSYWFQGSWAPLDWFITRCWQVPLCVTLFPGVRKEDRDRVFSLMEHDSSHKVNNYSDIALDARQWYILR